MSVRVGMGFGAFPFSSAEAFWRWLDFCEDGEIDSIWLSERLVSAQPVLEPLTALAAIAGRTRRLKFGMNATVLPLRDPFLLAKECATIDYLSAGRLLPVFGVGNDVAPEWQSLGADSHSRGQRSNEMLAVMTRLWSEETVTFHGKYFNYENASLSPKPKQSPLPLWIGGASEAAIERTARFGTGWLAGGAQSPSQIGKTIATIRERAGALGRPIDNDHYGAGLTYRFGDWHEAVVERNAEALKARLGPAADIKTQMAVGGAAEVMQSIQALVAVGVSKFVARPLATDEADFLEQTRRLQAEVIPLAHKLG